MAHFALPPGQVHCGWCEDRPVDGTRHCCDTARGPETLSILGLSDECQEKYPLLEGNGHEGLRTNHLRAAPPQNVSDRQDPIGVYLTLKS
ncbi:unnamed protein product [Arctogadus glacialis]